MLTNENGGILDDCVICSRADHIYMVVNGACKDADMAHIRAHLKTYNQKNSADVTMQYNEDRSLLALQGPKAAEVLSRLVKEDLNTLQFMYTRNMKVGSLDCLVTRCGYTGEDGFEISVASTQATQLMDLLLKHKEVLPAGLGVRDSLRLEAGLCLYGHDLNDTITPIEAGLAWTISKRRRTEGGFPGFAKIKQQLEQGTENKRIGLLVKKGAPAREGAVIQSKNGEKIGIVTSGTFSPSLNKAIAMGYVKSAHSNIGTQLDVEVRGKLGDAEVVKMPFVPNRYFKPA
jgi:aminomethyltransferase